MSEPLISIIIPVYNTEKYLMKCVESVRNQTYRNLEIILVDDGSKDRSSSICDELSAEDSRIQVIHQPNGGSSVARNSGLDAVTGEYIGFIDSDDDIDPHMYEQLMKQALELRNQQDYKPKPKSQQHSSNVRYIVQCGREEWSEEGERLPDVCTAPEQTEILTGQQFLSELLMHREDCSMCTKLFEASMFCHRRFPVGELNEDFRVLIQMLLEINGVAKIPFSGYHVCYRMGSNTRKTDENDFSSCFYDNITSADYVAGIVADKYPDLNRIAMRFGLFQRLDYMLHIPVRDMKHVNEEYRSVVQYLRKHFGAMLSSRYLTKKNKAYLILLTWIPVLTRKIHRAKMRHQA